MKTALRDASSGLYDSRFEHVAATGSEKGKRILADFSEYLKKFKKIIPYDYEKMTTMIVQFEEKGLSSEQARIEAFYKGVKGGRA